jgi:hypothetical protein
MARVELTEERGMEGGDLSARVRKEDIVESSR